MTKFIHQATVRRKVVIKLIENAKARGHRAYKHVNLEAMRAKAQSLPEHGVPPEIVKLLPHDDDLDKLQIQKNAAPVPGRIDLSSTDANLIITQPNAVLQEQSGENETDLNAQRVAALRHLCDRLAVEEDDSSDTEPETKVPRTEGTRETEDPTLNRFKVITGNRMVDQFQPWYFGVAFAFLFKYCTGMPDMPAFLEKERYARFLNKTTQYMYQTCNTISGTLVI